MAKIISTHSFRGGTGKSNTTANLAVLTAKQGYRVAVIDTDIQSPGIHVLFRLQDHVFQHTLNDFLWGKCKVQEASIDVTERSIGNVEQDGNRPRLYLIPSSIKTGEIARVLREGYDVSLLNDGFRDLVRELNLDFLFIDTHPGVNEETLLSIAVSDALVLLVRPDQQDFQGTAVTVELAKKLGVPNMLAVLNKVPPGMDPSQLGAKVASLFNIEVAGILPLCVEMAKVASSDLFCNRYPDHLFTQELKSIVRRLLASFS